MYLNVCSVIMSEYHSLSDPTEFNSNGGDTKVLDLFRAHSNFHAVPQHSRYMINSMLDSGIRPFNLRSSVAVFQDSEPEPRIGADGNLFWPHPSSIDQKAGSGGLSSSIPSVLFPDHEELLLLESLIVRAQDRRKSNDQSDTRECN